MGLHFPVVFLLAAICILLRNLSIGQALAVPYSVDVGDLVVEDQFSIRCTSTVTGTLSNQANCPRGSTTVTYTKSVSGSSGQPKPLCEEMFADAKKAIARYISAVSCRLLIKYAATCDCVA